MNNDDQKIVWKKSAATTDEVGTSSASDSLSAIDPSSWTKSSKQKLPQSADTDGASMAQQGGTDMFSGTDALNVSKRAADVKSSIEKDVVANDLDSVRADIAKMLNADNGVESTTKSDAPLDGVAQKDVSSAPVNTTVPSPKSFNIKDEIDKVLKAQTKESLKNKAPVGASVITTESVQESQENIEALKASINSELGQESVKTEKVTSKGIEQTYYGDVSGAMGSNKPSTMAELLQKARFEKKEKAILSPTSKRNILFIIGGIVLLGLAIFLFARVFQSEKQVEYITEKRVDSLVFSNLDTGINLTDIGAEKTKQAIRKVVETDLEEGSLNQVYYVSEDQDKNIRRLNVKQVFDATEHTPPQLLYENLETDFMHGVYKTDKNHPFLILKSLTYDKVFEGMQEWEPTMIDDLATYFDLPAEATDRSLIQDGFSDDIINNKNVRVARFIPRDKDRSLLERIGDKIIETSARMFSPVYAQAVLDPYVIFGSVVDVTTGAPIYKAGVILEPLGISTQSNRDGSFNVTVSDGKPQNIEFRRDGYKSQFYSVTNESVYDVALEPADPEFDNLVCYEKFVECYNDSGDIVNSNLKGTPGVSCFDSIKNGPNDPTYPAEIYHDNSNYSCVKIAGTQDYLGGKDFEFPINTADVCFHVTTGKRLNTTDQSRPDYVSPGSPLAVCFPSYECRLFACRDRFQNDVPASEQGKPGITCGETLESVAADDPRQKICREYSDLRLLDNINQSKICFDENGKFVQTFTDGSFDGDPTNDVNCITPTNRNQRLCLNGQNQVVIPAPGAPDSLYKICFDPLEGASLGGVGDQYGGLTDDLRQLAASIARELELAAALAQLTGFSSENVKKINDASDFFYQVAYVDVLENDLIETSLTIVKNIETIVNVLDPNGTIAAANPGGIFAKLNLAIDFIKKAFGFDSNITWVTIGNDLPKGTVIYAGEAVDGVEAIQEALVLIGLMDPVSVTGTLDLVTQDAISELQDLNDIAITGIVDLETLELITGMVDGYGEMYGGENIGIVNDYFDETPYIEGSSDVIGVGSYGEHVQALQILLYSEGYGVEIINGIYDEQTCLAVMAYQEFNGLVLTNPDDGHKLSAETIESLNRLIREGDYLGSGFALNPDGFLEGVGSLSGTVGPGVVSFATDAEAASLREGDIVLMYTFLDEETILITRHESVLTEIIKRRALDDIFNK